MNLDAYLARIGLDSTDTERATLQALERIQQAHVRRVPFETLAITGDPHGDDEGAGVTLDTEHLSEKIVDRERGGYCFELNGLAHWLLDALGYDVDRVAARVVGDDGTGRPPANHHANVVELDRRYLVDVGMGIPTMRAPVALDGEVRTDAVGVDWRIVECDRPDEQYMTQYRGPAAEAWTDRYMFSPQARELSYFAATNDYLQSAPESPFTGDPTVTRATESGHIRLEPDSLQRYDPVEVVDEWPVDESTYHDALAEEFGLRFEPAPDA